MTITQALSIMKRGNITPEERAAIQALLATKSPADPEGRRLGHGAVKVVYQAPPEMAARLLPFNQPVEEAKRPAGQVKVWREQLNQNWKRMPSFSKCQNCGEGGYYKSLDIRVTKHHTWCYVCGAKDLRVTLDPEVYEMLVKKVVERMVKK